MSRPQGPGSTGPGSTGPASTGNGHELGLAARVRERWGVHGRGQHERDRAEARPVDLHAGVRERAGRSGGGRHGGARNAGGEQFVVPRARPDSYYGKPIIKEPVNGHGWLPK